ncbi:PREDICTED: uncharacterized protein LOC109240664 [Nicotiana attenuata]|uniref:uncharacterized protein LOC109240664 n=1 Tax=Nicotiana attenuata TaxID=49451 RepID=UPI0009058535|nr:PREDICTED: uncharacterized protein LOC109240664 [Nicotiana attenuata]
MVKIGHQQQLQELTPPPESNKVHKGEEPSESQQVPRYFQVTEGTDATKSTVEKLDKSHYSRSIPLEVAVHKLSLDPNIPPVRQKKRPIAEVRNRFVKEEVTRFLDFGSIREVKYPDWLANGVVVAKENNKLRMCVDYKALNKTCAKGSFPLPNID